MRNVRVSDNRFVYSRTIETRLIHLLATNVSCLGFGSKFQSTCPVHSSREHALRFVLFVQYTYVPKSLCSPFISSNDISLPKMCNLPSQTLVISIPHRSKDNSRNPSILARERDRSRHYAKEEITTGVYADNTPRCLSFFLASVTVRLIPRAVCVSSLRRSLFCKISRRRRATL